MTDLETQLRDCLSRHAEAVDVRPDLAVTTRVRSRQLSRRRSAATVVAIVPITAAIVIGAVALSGGSSHSPELRVQPVASSTATPPTAPVTAQHGVRECKPGTVADVAPVTRNRFLAPGGPQTVTNLLHVLHQRFDLKVKAAAWSLNRGNQGFEISGSPAGAGKFLFNVAVQSQQHVRHQFWFVLVHRHHKLVAEQVRFLGCVAG